MGIKLKNNQKMLKIKYYLILVAVILLISCKSNAGIGSTKKESILAYKIAVFYGCVDAATNRNLSEFTEKNNDLGLAPETAILYHSVVLDAINTGAELAKKIKAPIYSDYQGKRPIFSDCMDFAFREKSIDSMARVQYKKLIKGKMEYIYE